MSAVQESIEAFLIKIKESLQESGRNTKKKRLRTMLWECGYTRRSPKLIDDILNEAKKLELKIEPEIDMFIDFDTMISFSIQSSHKKCETLVQKNTINNTDIRVQDTHLKVFDDIFYYLFDFATKDEYDTFLACINANRFVGIFIIPGQEDFVSEIVEKLLSYYLIRKKQYKGEPISFISAKADFESQQSGEAHIDTGDNGLLPYGIFDFDKELMDKVFFGDTGIGIVDSKKFDDQLRQITLYTNKYISRQGYILFHCPPENELKLQNKEDMLGQLVSKVSGKVPFVFTLRCRYSVDREITKEIREKLIRYFSVLLELPSYKLDDEDLPILDSFVEMQKAQAQYESQLLLNMKPEYFMKMKWGFESDEHIYLKYFSLKTLVDRGFKLADIQCEQEVSPEIDTRKARRPDVYVKGKVIVEVETLRGKTSGDEVYLSLINNILYKIDGWQSELEELWLVLPGFEIAWNKQKLKKASEIIKAALVNKYGNLVNVLIMAPDYSQQRVTSIDIGGVDFSELKTTKDHQVVMGTSHCIQYKNLQLDFSCIQGLEEEKGTLKKLLKLKDKGLKMGIGGVLLYGLPGCGKTLLVKAFANEADRYFLQFSPADVQSMWIGQTQKNIKDIFLQAKQKAPSILFIDELDSIAFSRNESQAHTDQKASINQLLIELNDIKKYDVLVFGATNMLEKIDPAFKRSGRFDWKIPIFPPDAKERAELFQYYLGRVKDDIPSGLIDVKQFDYIDHTELGIRSIGFTPSDIELVCNEIKQDILLDEIQALSPQTIFEYIEKFSSGGLSLTKQDVKAFVEECETLKVKSAKVSFIKEEWGLTR